MNKPKRQSVSYTRYEGNYDLCHPKNKQVQYVFQFNSFDDRAKERGLKVGYVIDIENDNNYSINDYSVLDLANELLAIYNTYWFTSSKADIIQVIQFLEEIEEENNQLNIQDKINEAKFQLDYWQNQLKTLEDIK